MKKVIAIFVMFAFAACNGTASTEAPAVDSAACINCADSTKVESAVAPVADSTSPVLEAK